jgi:hypothetical protein
VIVKFLFPLPLSGARSRRVFVLDTLDGPQAHLMLCTLLLARVSQIALMAPKVNAPPPLPSTPQSWFDSSGKWQPFQMRYTILAGIHFHIWSMCWEECALGMLRLAWTQFTSFRLGILANASASLIRPLVFSPPLVRLL